MPYRRNIVNFRERKQAIRGFMQAHYTDARLAELLAHAQDGKLNYVSCCCFIGCATADHALQAGYGTFNPMLSTGHVGRARKLTGADAAEDAFRGIAITVSNREDTRRRILIPMIRAEMKRRATLRGLFEDVFVDQTLAEVAQ